MSKFASKTVKPTAAPIRTRTVAPDTQTYEAGAGWSRDPKSDLFLLAVSNFVSERTFYEEGKTRDERYVSLLAQVTKDDPGWVRDFLPFLRDKMFMRSAAVVGAAEYIRAGGAKGRQLVAQVLRRADEPAELVAYWINTYGRRLPQPLKRGIADAVLSLYNERNALKWDSERRDFRMGDVIELTHPKAERAWQGDLFKWLLATRHSRNNIELPEALGMIRARAELEAVPVEARRELIKDMGRLGSGGMLAAAGMTWESLSGWLQGPMDKAAWEAIIPSMGYMALLRNLRNFDEAKVGKTAREFVIRKLTDPAEVAKSKQLPLRFYSAYDQVKTPHWTDALKTALDLTLGNVPELPGKTLILIDISSSMSHPFSAKTDRQYWEMAALFGGALGARAEKADVYAYTDVWHQIVVRPGMSPLIVVDAIRPLGRAGTKTWDAAKATYKDHDRVIILTDEQAFPFDQSYEDRYRLGLYRYEEQSSIGPAAALPANVPVFTFNVAGYKVAHAPSGIPNRHAFGGLSDAAFTVIPMLEQRRISDDWSFLRAA